ncbi:MAG: hypothetical protein LRY27_03215 [Chitinophagales bacterium]|nr:hypothetical protein [Chitinophagales bacterium]
MDIPQSMYKVENENYINEAQKYISTFEDTVEDVSMSFFIGPNINMVKSDLVYFKDMLPMFFYHRNFEALDVAFSNRNLVSYFKAKVYLTDLNKYRELYIISTLSKSFSIGLVAEYEEKEFNFDKYVNTIKISKK